MNNSTETIHKQSYTTSLTPINIILNLDDGGDQIKIGSFVYHIQKQHTDLISTNEIILSILGSKVFRYKVYGSVRPVLNRLVELSKIVEANKTAGLTELSVQLGPTKELTQVEGEHKRVKNVGAWNSDVVNLIKADMEHIKNELDEQTAGQIIRDIIQTVMTVSGDNNKSQREQLEERAKTVEDLLFEAEETMIL